MITNEATAVNDLSVGYPYYVTECNYDDWQNFNPQIIAQQIFCEVRTAGPKYDGPRFRYCQYCGRQLNVHQKWTQIAPNYLSSDHSFK